MRYFLYAIMITLSCSMVRATDPEKIAILSAKIILENNNGYFIFDDGSCWKAFGFTKRWRSLKEWWNNTELVPQNYECLPNDWTPNAQIAVYPKYENLQVNESNASNQNDLRRCTHLLVNEKGGTILFAIPLPQATCLIEACGEVRQDGYDEGFAKGRLSAFQNSQEIYNEGYQAGYKDGCKAVMEGAIQPD